MKLIKIVSFYLLFGSVLLIASQAGKVYLVLGSDTAIWDGMSTGRFHCTYDLSLYTDPTRNANQIMDSSYRNQFVDSYGTPMKMTWWMMCGNIFRYATNTNIPIPNIMTMYLMKKYYLPEINAIGDELSLHYHTFKWSDYDGDGLWYWNQALTFSECRDDWNFTLCQLLLEEQVFPVSFRSGWHYMDNEWQQNLNDLLPYSMHNAYPSKKTEDTEPLDNVIDWSQAPSEFVPYHPAPENYQLPGDSPGWNLRSAHFWGVRARDLMDTVFAAAANGTDQIACFWGHLPETDFNTNVEIMDSLAHKMANKYPEVKFRYCTAIEGMQRWQQTSDSLAPEVTLEQTGNETEIGFRITSNEATFQPVPFLAVKDIYENYFIMDCYATGTNTWETTETINRELLAKVGAALCDSMGNQSMEFIKYLPDDQFIDNTDDGYTELAGNWTTTTDRTWGLDARISTLSENDSNVVQWTPAIQKSGLYNLFIQVPTVNNAAEHTVFKIIAGGIPVDTITFDAALPPDEWIYISTTELSAGASNHLQMKIKNTSQTEVQIAADVAKFSALVREYDLVFDTDLIYFGEVSVEDTVTQTLKLQNQGYQALTIQEVTSLKGLCQVTAEFPLQVPQMGSIQLPVWFYSTELGSVSDTLLITSNDPRNPQSKIPVSADVRPFFTIIDNEDSVYYQEYGNWHTSVAEAYGPSSRYAWLNSSPLASAEFQSRVKKNGIYEIFEIVPRTVNATDHALYKLIVGETVKDSIIINQNTDSGGWISLGQYYLPADEAVKIKVIDTGQSTLGHVLRADAIKISLIEEVTQIADSQDQIPLTYSLGQNYPNPFNATTTIPYTIPKQGRVQVTIYNTLGQTVVKLVDEIQTAGQYQVKLQVGHYGSGIYLYQLKTDQYCATKKLILVK